MLLAVAAISAASILAKTARDARMRELALETPPRPDDAADALAVALTAWFQR
jgi:hypothetical protein